MSPEVARKLISNEMLKSVDTCGTRNPPAQHDENQTNNAVPMETVSSSNNNCNNGTNLEQSNLPDLIENYLPVDSENTCRLDKNRGKALPRNDDKSGFEDNNVNAFLDYSSAASVCHSNKHFIDLLPLENMVSSIENDLKNLKVVVSIPEDVENLKEQISPKENKSEEQDGEKLAVGTKPFKDKENEHSLAERLVVKVENVPERPKTTVQKAKDILNAEKRSESPRDKADIDRFEEFIRQEKERSKNPRRDKKKKRNRRNNRGNTEDSQDFDTLYRLPTEHLTRHRNSVCEKDRNFRNVEEQLRRHEEINERRKMVELEREKCIGAVGGYQLESEDSLPSNRGRMPNAGNVSPSSEHSRDSSPSNEDTTHRRIEH